MALSREEHRALVGIERALRMDDPRFVARFQQPPVPSRARWGYLFLNLVSGAVLLAIGLFGAGPGYVVLAVAGFLGIVVGTVCVRLAIRRRRQRRPRPPG